MEKNRKLSLFLVSFFLMGSFTRESTDSRNKQVVGVNTIDVDVPTKESRTFLHKPIHGLLLMMEESPSLTKNTKTSIRVDL